MAHRPYPNRERALNQLGRHYPGPPVAVLECLRPLGEAFDRMRENARKAAADAETAGTYVLSTRRSVDDGRVVTLSPGSAPAEVSRFFSPAFVEQVNQTRRPGTVSGPS